MASTQQPPPDAGPAMPGQQPPQKSSNKGLWTLLIVFGGLFAVFFVFVFLLFNSMGSGAKGDNQIGVVEVKGPIVSSEKIVKDIRDFSRNDDIKGLIIRIDTPGGAVGASQEILEAIKDVEKPVVMSMGNIAASGGFYIACAGPKVFANPGTITGSIGVISQQFEVDELMDMIKVEVNTVTSGEFKDSGNPFRDFTEKDRQVYEDLIMDVYDQFVTTVAEARDMKREEVLPWADGRVFTGRQAKEAGLIDDLGGFEAAVDWLADDIGMEGEPTLVYPKREMQGLFDLLVDQGVQRVKGEVNQIRNLETPTLEYRYNGPFSR